MPSSTRSKHSGSSPISGVPYDILREIFIHCLPRHPLRRSLLQPNTTIAPMLLCHICSSWRTVALSSPTLWSHLAYRVHFQYDSKHQDLPDGDNNVFRHEIDFIKWWKEKQGLVAPFLLIDVHDGNKSESTLFAEDGMTTLLEYLMPAQYLQINNTLWWELRDTLELEESDYQSTFPNLHTLVISDLDFRIPDDLYNIRAFIGRQPGCPLRRLSIDGGDFEDPHPYDIARNGVWSALTHLSLRNFVLPLKFWSVFIRSVPVLQWACIEFHYIYNDVGFPTPTEHVIPQLSTLFLGDGGRSSDERGQTALLFAGLQLPALRTLSISCESMDHDYVPVIRTILQSTPAITTLALKGYDFRDEVPYFAEMQNIAGQPIWRCTPHLENVQLELPHPLDRSRYDMDTFFRDTFFSDIRWLALDIPLCPIQTITLVDEGPSNPRFNWFKDIVMESIQRHAGGASNLTFKLSQIQKTCPSRRYWRSGIHEIE